MYQFGQKYLYFQFSPIKETNHFPKEMVNQAQEKCQEVQEMMLLNTDECFTILKNVLVVPQTPKGVQKILPRNG